MIESSQVRDNFYYIEPDVSGELGIRTELDSSVHPPSIKKLHFVFADWSGDALIRTFPCYLVTDELKHYLIGARATGVYFSEVEISTSDNFSVLSQNVTLPLFVWMKVTGEFCLDDLSISDDYRLVISEKVLRILNEFQLIPNARVSKVTLS